MEERKPIDEKRLTEEEELVERERLYPKLTEEEFRKMAEEAKEAVRIDRLYGGR